MGLADGHQGSFQGGNLLAGVGLVGHVSRNCRRRSRQRLDALLNTPNLKLPPIAGVGFARRRRGGGRDVSAHAGHLVDFLQTGALFWDGG